MARGAGAGSSSPEEVRWWPGRTATGLDPGAPFRIAGAHTDSPNLRIKPRPDTGGFGWKQLAVEVYGGALWNSWLDRDLGLSGRWSSTITDPSQVAPPRDTPLLRVPQLAIHLDRDVNGQGLKLNPQQHLTPVWGTGPRRRASSPSSWWKPAERRARHRAVSGRRARVGPHAARPHPAGTPGPATRAGRLGPPRQPPLVLGRGRQRWSTPCAPPALRSPPPSSASTTTRRWAPRRRPALTVTCSGQVLERAATLSVAAHESSTSRRSPDRSAPRPTWPTPPTPTTPTATSPATRSTSTGGRSSR